MDTNRRRRNRQELLTAAAVALVLAGAPPTTAQTGGLRGQVVNARTQEAVANAEVSLVQVDLVGLTDEEGAFLLQGIPVGRYTLLVRTVGFKPILVTGQMIMPDTTVDVAFELEPEITEIEGLPVSNDTFRRSPNTIAVLGADDLPKDRELLQALDGRVPGLNLITSQTASGAEALDQRSVTVRRSIRQVLFVLDGMVVTPPLTIHLNTSDVECVEVRRGSSAVHEFQRDINGPSSDIVYSGVVIIWTRGTRAPMNADCRSEG